MLVHIIIIIYVHLCIHVIEIVSSCLYFNYFYVFIKINLPYVKNHQIHKNTLLRNSYKIIILVLYITSAVQKMDKFGFMLYYLDSLMMDPCAPKHVELLRVIL